MRRSGYNTMVREFVNMANAMERAWQSDTPYDYARNGGSNGENGKSANGNGETHQAQRTAYLPVNAWADADTFTFQANLPGVNPDDVEITFENDVLTIRGEFPAAQSEEDENIKYIKHELFSGPFERRLSFSTAVDADKIEAVYENGVLTLTVPKAEEVRPKQITVKTR